MTIDTTKATPRRQRKSARARKLSTSAVSQTPRKASPRASKSKVSPPAAPAVSVDMIPDLFRDVRSDYDLSKMIAEALVLRSGMSAADLLANMIGRHLHDLARGGRICENGSDYPHRSHSSVIDLTTPVTVVEAEISTLNEEEILEDALDRGLDQLDDIFTSSMFQLPDDVRNTEGHEESWGITAAMRFAAE